jgi:hypothetical protein
MASSTTHSHGTTPVRTKYTRIGVSLYVLTLVTFITLLLIEPKGLDFRLAIIPLTIALFITGLAPARLIASKTKRIPVTVVGTIALAILFVFFGLFIIAGAAWLIILARM